MQIKKLFIILFCLFLLLAGGCAEHPVKKAIKKTTGYSGNIWWKFVVKTRKKEKKFGGKADFKIGKNYLIVKIKTFLGTTAGIVLWEKSKSSEIKFYDYIHDKLYVIKTQNPVVNRLPEIFLGKEPSCLLKFRKLSLLYTFDSERKSGKLQGEHLEFMWKIRKIKNSETSLSEIKKIHTRDKKFKKIILNF